MGSQDKGGRESLAHVYPARSLLPGKDDLPARDQNRLLSLQDERIRSLREISPFFPVLDWIAALTVHIHFLFPPGWSCSLFAVKAMWENAESGVAPCQCFSSAVMCTTSPTPMTSWCASVAMIPLPRGDKQHLIAAMGVHFVPGTSTEVDNDKIEIVAHLQASIAFVVSRDRP